jgi:hypothetical protein
MDAALFDADGVAKMIMKNAPREAVELTAAHYDLDWREVNASIKRPDEVPHLSTFPPRD